MSRHSPDHPAYRLGHETLGPVFAAFAMLLLRETSARGITRLAFIARDGDLLRDATAGLQSGTGPGPELRYLHVSRRLTALAVLTRLELADIDATHRVRAGPPTLGKCLEYFGLDSLPLTPWLVKYGLDVAASPPRDRLVQLLADPGFRGAVATQAAAQRARLHHYLRQEAILDDHTTGCVDIGWRGSTQRHLEAVLGSSAMPLRWFYFGLWNDHAAQPAPANAIGLIGDQRRRSSLLEGAARQAAHLLEAVCRRNEGTALGYDERDGCLVPRLLSDDARRAEIACAKVVAPIRSGILDRVAELAADARWLDLPTPELRRRAQHTLRQLAFFPSAEAIEIGRRLVHTEGHDTAWHAPLILPGPHPWHAPRRWLAGLASPWRAGYVSATAGPIGALLFALQECTFSRLPVSMHAGLANLARRLAGIPVQPGDKGPP